MNESGRCETCSGIAGRPWLLLDRCIEFRNVKRRKVWSGLTFIVRGTG